MQDSSPFLKLPGGNQCGSRVRVPVPPGLPPNVIFLAHNLQDVSPPELQACVLTWDGGVLFRIIVEECPGEDLEESTNTL